MNLLRPILVAALFLFTKLPSYAQNDSVSNSPSPQANAEKASYFEGAWAPVGLSLLSISLMTDSSKYGLQKLIRAPFNGYENHMDDYIQYAPIAVMYTADLFRIPAKNTVWNQTKFLAMSELGTSAIVQILKYSLKIQRPNNGSFNSYPSGHASQAFVASQVLFNEFKETNKLVAYSGFLFSIPTGALRIINNRHWVPDVLLGAGIAMLVTNTIYYFEPLKNWTPRIFKNRNTQKKTQIGFVPTWNDDYIGGYLTLKF